jgi:hypothetical protein
MVGDPPWLDFPGQGLKFSQILEIQRICAADREGDSVHHDWISLGDLIQDITRPALRIHEVLRDDLKPVHRGPFLQDIVEVHRAQADPEPKMCIPQAFLNHNGNYLCNRLSKFGFVSGSDLIGGAVGN